jgi:penicillin-binding protein 1A
VLYTRRRDSLFFNYVYDRLVERYGAQVAQQGGLRVYTTISPKLQRAAYRAVTDTLPGKDDPAAAVVSIDPQTGYIRAMAARAPTRRNLVFNLAAQGRRQPGSTFKVFALAEAIRRGIDPDRTFYMSAPFEFAAGPGAEPWQVGNGSGYYGSLSLREAIVRSDNTVFARLGLDLGPSRIAATARQLGIRSHLPGIPSLVLGTVPVTPLEMASAYATIASGGIYRQPEAIQEVRFPNGKKETAHRSRARRVLSEAQAALITDILGDAVSRGTGTGAQIGRPQAGKTGTTEDYSDAWFVGYVPQLATSVWVGYPARSVPMTNVHGITVYGGTFPAEIWRRFMWNALLKAPAREFPYASPPPFESWHGTAQWRSSATPSDLHG